MGLPNEKIANEIYDVLVMCGGARSDDRASFVHTHITENYPCNEYRFQGHFGFGGKFYSHESENIPWYVGYHPDDVKGKNEELYHSLMIAMNTILISIWEKWKVNAQVQVRASANHPQVAPVSFALPDQGDDAVDVNLLTPSGEKVTVSYVANTGQMDVCVYAPQDGSDHKAPGAPGFTPKRVAVTCWIDEVDDKGHYVSSMHPAPKWNTLDHQRLATQIVLSVGPNRDEIFPEKEGE